VSTERLFLKDMHLQAAVYSTCSLRLYRNFTTTTKINSSRHCIAKFKAAVLFI